MSKRVQSSRGHVSEGAPQSEVRSIQPGDARVIFQATGSSSWVWSSKQKVLFLGRPAGTTSRDGAFTPAAGNAFPRCTSTRRRERHSLFEGGWSRTKSSARLFAIPLVLLGYRFRSFRTFSRPGAASRPGSSREVAQPIRGEHRRPDPPPFPEAANFKMAR